MKELLLQSAQYNLWANRSIIDTLLALPGNTAHKELNSSFPSIKDTALHSWSAEYIWLQRLQEVAEPLWIQGMYVGLFKEICNNWIKTSAQLVDYVKQIDKNSLSDICTYKDRKGNAYTTPVWQILHHVFNHATYHRGQLVTMLREVGATQIPGTDFIAFVRQ